MPVDVGYESGSDRGKAVRDKRRTVIGRSLVGFGLLAMCATFLVGVVAYQASLPSISHVTLIVTNVARGLVADAGFDGIYNERVVSVGPVGPGQTRRTFVDFNENLCPIAFSFDQNGQTWRVPLSGNLIDDGSTYTVTIAPGSVVARCVGRGGATTRFARTPSTKPIQY